MRDIKLPKMPIPPPARVTREGSLPPMPEDLECLNIKSYDSSKVSVSIDGKIVELSSEPIEIKKPKRVLDFSVTIKDIGEIKGDLHVDEENYNRYMEYLKTKDVEV